MWIFDQTPWTDVDQSLTIRILLLTGRHRHGNSTAGHPRSSPAPLLLLSSALTGMMLSGQSTKTNKAASDVTFETRVVVSFVCVEWRGIALSPTGHRLAVYSVLSGGINQMTVFEIIIAVLRRLSDCVLAYYSIMHDRVNVAVNWACVWQAVHTRHVHNIVQSLSVTIIARSPIPRSISRYRLIDMNHRFVTSAE